MDLTIAYQGVAGSFNHLAAVNFYGKDNTFLGTEHSSQVFDLLESNESKYGVVPMENSWSGAFRDSHDYIFSHQVYIIGEVYLPVVLNLLAIPDTDLKLEERLKKIHKVISHPRALDLCQPFFDSHPWMSPTFFADTAQAAQYISDRADDRLAAVASSEAASLYGLEIVAPAIQRSTTNVTRFVCLGTSPEYPKDSTKCSIHILLHHKPGALLSALDCLAKNGMNITRIESRIEPDKTFQYGFIIDFEFSENSNVSHCLSTLKELETKVEQLRTLGIYPSLHLARD